MTVQTPILRDYALTDRYTKSSGRVFMTGTQAILRIALDQARRDRARGLDTRGYVSGYRGSPLGRRTNWSSDTAGLRKRGVPLVWLGKEMTWHAPHEGRSGRPPVFSNSAIRFCLPIRVLFDLPLRQTAGLVASLLRRAGLDWRVSRCSTRCRRQKTPAVQIPYRRASGRLPETMPTCNEDLTCLNGCCSSFVACRAEWLWLP